MCQPGDHIAVLKEGSSTWRHGIVFSLPPESGFQVVYMSSKGNVRVRSFESFAPPKTTVVVGVVSYDSDSPELRELSLERARYLLNII
jgi:hypothetical protein